MLKWVSCSASAFDVMCVLILFCGPDNCLTNVGSILGLMILFISCNDIEFVIIHHERYADIDYYKRYKTDKSIPKINYTHKIVQCERNSISRRFYVKRKEEKTK